jgi:hypothetical protein
MEKGQIWEFIENSKLKSLSSPGQREIKTALVKDPKVLEKDFEAKVIDIPSI